MWYMMEDYISFRRVGLLLKITGKILAVINVLVDSDHIYLFDIFCFLTYLAIPQQKR